MASNDINDINDLASYMKVAQLHVALKNALDVVYFERILQNEGDINYDATVSNNNSVDNGMNFNVLHSAYSNDQYYVFQLLVSYGADFTTTDSENRTVIHRAIHDHCNNLIKMRYYIDPILWAHVNVGQIANPRCKYGISHFHIACMTNHVEAVEFFLKNGVAVDQTVNEKSPIFADYTPLHFTARYSCLETAEILLRYGANVQLKNVAGMTPMHILMERKIVDGISKWPRDEARESMIKLLLHFNINERVVDDYGISNLHVACILDDTSVAESILTDRSLDVNQSVNIDSPIYPGYTPLHFAVTSNINTIKLLLTKGADIEAKDAKDVTSFDLCLQNHKVEDIHYIMSSQSYWKEITLSNGKTRLLDLVAAMKGVNEFRLFLAIIESIADLTVPPDSPLWPGYTILHLAVTLFEKAGSEKDFGYWICECQMIEECFVRVVDITKRDANNRTALHLAFYLNKEWILDTLLKYHPTVENPFDSNNLSHFHIACAVGDENAVERFLSNGCIDVDVPIASTVNWPVPHYSHDSEYEHKFFFSPGSTALHFTIAFVRVEITKMLLDHGANIYAKDCNGFTPIHRLLTCYTNYFIPDFDNLLLSLDESLSSLDGLRDSIAECSLSHLHAACYSGLVRTVEKLLDNGADVNAVVNYKATNPNDINERKDYIFYSYDDSPRKLLSFLSRYNGFTPLDFSSRSNNPNISILLVQRGADVLIGNSLKNCSLIDYGMIENSTTSSDHLKDELGITELHIACYTRRLALVAKLLLQGENVNAKSRITYGNTPLHFAVVDIFGAEYESSELIELLLKNGADVTLRNDNGDTALDLLHRKHTNKLADCESARLLLKSIKDFDKDNIYSQGMPFLHYACLMKDARVVKKFLKNGIDVNKPVDYLADKYAGCRPLHFAAGYQPERFEAIDSQLRIINLLLGHGADARAVDVFKNTPLHSAVSCHSSRKTLLNILIRHGADVDAENICGETALELLMKSDNVKWEEVQCLLKHGSRIKFYNPISQKRYIENLFKCRDRGSCFGDEHWHSRYENALDNEILRNLITSEYVTRIDHDGRNFLQNIVFLGHINDEDFFELIERLVKRGCNINHQDNEGRTVLHLATLFRDYQSIKMLLRNGADVNVIDNHGKTAFAYCFEDPYDRSSSVDTNLIFITFSMHLHKMDRCGLYINEINQQLRVLASEMPEWTKDEIKLFEETIERTKSIKIGSTSLTLFDFGFKINAEMVYQDMSHLKRLEIDQFFEYISQHNLHELDYLLKFKYKKARDMLLINLAIAPFRIIVENQLPEVCCRVILSFLSSADLENVIATAKDL